MNPQDQAKWVTQLEALKKEDAYRTLETLETRLHPREGFQARRVGETRWLQHFSSNDYLNLSQHPALKHAALEAIEAYGVGVNSSRLVAGNHPLYAALEETLARWKGTEAALVFPSGYQANVAILQALCDKNSIILMDKLNHASLIDGARLSGAQWFRYRHLDLADLEKRLKTLRQKHGETTPIWLVSDSLFSMDGDVLDLSAWCDLAARYGCYTFLDEAHASGVFGPEKRSGLAEAAGCSQRITIQLGTFSKALGSFGAYVACSETLKQVLVNKARGLIYTTALPPVLLAVNQAAVNLVWQDARPTQQLWANVKRFHAYIEAHLPELAALQQPLSPSQIIPYTVGNNEAALDLAKRLEETQGWLVKAIRPPTVPPGQARIRVSLCAGNVL